MNRKAALAAGRLVSESELIDIDPATIPDWSRIATTYLVIEGDIPRARVGPLSDTTQDAFLASVAACDATEAERLRVLAERRRQFVMAVEDYERACNEPLVPDCLVLAEGVQVTGWGLPAGVASIPASWGLSDVDDLVARRDAAWRAAIARRDAANALVRDQSQPLVEAARQAREAKEAEEAATRAAALAEKKSRRAAIGAVEISITRGGREWGVPWGATVTAGRGAKDTYDFDAGSYDLATEILTIKCQPGDVIAWGQKNYRKAPKSIHERRHVSGDWELVKR